MKKAGSKKCDLKKYLGGKVFYEIGNQACPLFVEALLERWYAEISNWVIDVTAIITFVCANANKSKERNEKFKEACWIASQVGPNFTIAGYRTIAPRLKKKARKLGFDYTSLNEQAGMQIAELLRDDNEKWQLILEAFATEQEEVHSDAELLKDLACRCESFFISLDN